MEIGHTAYWVRSQVIKTQKQQRIMETWFDDFKKRDIYRNKQTERQTDIHGCITPNDNANGGA